MQAYKLEASTRKKVLVNKFDLQMDNNLRDKDGSEVVSADDNPTSRQCKVPQNRGFDEILDDLQKLEEELCVEADHTSTSIESRPHSSSPPPRTTPSPLMTSHDVLEEVVVELKSLLLPGVEHRTSAMKFFGSDQGMDERTTGEGMVNGLVLSEKMVAGDSSFEGSCEDFRDSCSSCAPSGRSSSSIQPLQEVMKIYVEGGRSRNVSITTSTTSRDILDQLSFDVQRFSLVEVTPALFLECSLEDDEILSEVLQTWSFASENCFMVAENNYKYDMFANPHKYFSKSSNEVNHPSGSKKQEYVQEYVRNQFVAPDCDGMLFMKTDGKKCWRKYYFVLRPSGLYYCPKGKGKSLMDLVCLQQLYSVRIYSGLKWKKKFKSPTEFCFALKHPKVQKQVPRFIKYFCAEDEDTKQLWINFIRLAKYGKLIYDNFQRLIVNGKESETVDKQEAKTDSNHKINPMDLHRLENYNFNDIKMSEHYFEMINSSSAHSPRHSIDEQFNEISKLGNGTSSKLLIDRRTASQEKPSNQNQQMDGNKHQTIKRALSSGTRNLRHDSNDFNFSRSCPQSPRIDGILLQTSSEYDLLSNQFKLCDESMPRHGEESKTSRITVNGSEGRECRRFAILAGSFKERLMSSKRREAHLKICDKRLGDCKNKDFDCLPPPPAELLSEFLSISKKQSNQL